MGPGSPANAGLLGREPALDHPVVLKQGPRPPRFGSESPLRANPYVVGRSGPEPADRAARSPFVYRSRLTWPQASPRGTCFTWKQASPPQCPPHLGAGAPTCLTWPQVSPPPVPASALTWVQVTRPPASPGHRCPPQHLLHLATGIPTPASPGCRCPSQPPSTCLTWTQASAPSACLTWVQCPPASPRHRCHPPESTSPECR